jgi:hypothetical protein
MISGYHRRSQNAPEGDWPRCGPAPGQACKGAAGLVSLWPPKSVIGILANAVLRSHGDVEGMGKYRTEGRPLK